MDAKRESTTPSVVRAFAPDEIRPGRLVCAKWCTTEFLVLAYCGREEEDGV